MDDRLKEEQKKNRNFVMTYRDHMPELRWLMRESGMAASILNFMMEHMDYHNSLECPYQVFQECFGVSKSTVRKSIKLLYENGFIDITKDGTFNIYTVNSKVAWSSWADQKSQCKFHGKALVSHKEKQDYSVHFEKLKSVRNR